MTQRHPRALALALAAVSLASAPAARAQMLVHDAASYAKILQQAQTAIGQLAQLKAQVAQGRQLLDSLNPVSDVNALASALNAPALRGVVPDAAAFVAAAHGDFAALGQIGRQAQAIRDASRRYVPAGGDPLDQALEAAGDRAARDLATAEAVGAAGAARLKGLQDLQTAIGTAANARAVLDLQARLGAEQAMTANDQLRLQALAMSQAAEARLARQTAQERAAAAAQARLAFYRSGFQ
jgi:type IV secretion system protein VirB5